MTTLHDPRLPARFWARVERNEWDCWEWTGALTGGGYARLQIGKSSTTMAHRFAYATLAGPIPAGMQLDHLCANRKCVNPAHLQPVSPQVNSIRAVEALPPVTHCKFGHEFTDENTIRNRKTGRRRCRTCAQAQNARTTERRRLERQAARAAS